MEIVYRRIATQTTQARCFSITVGLHEGYDPEMGVTHHTQTAKRSIMDWIRARGSDKLPYLNGPVTSCEYIYSHGSGREIEVGTEPSIQFTGTISTSHLADMPDSAVEAMLSDLAAHLAKALGQDRVEIVFMDQAWAITLQ